MYLITTITLDVCAHQLSYMSTMSQSCDYSCYEYDFFLNGDFTILQALSINWCHNHNYQSNENTRLFQPHRSAQHFWFRMYIVDSIYSFIDTCIHVCFISSATLHSRWERVRRGCIQRLHATGGWRASSAIWCRCRSAIYWIVTKLPGACSW